MVSRYRKRLLEKEAEPARRSGARGRFVIVVLLHVRHTVVRQCAAEEGGWAPLANLTLALSLTLPATNMCKRTQSQETSLAPPHFSTEESEVILADE